MEKYITDATLAKLVANEKNKKNSGSVFFSSKDKNTDGSDNADFFDKYAGQKLRIVGVEPTVFETEDEKDKTGKVIAKGEKREYNVVYFDDGHQLSTSRLFTAKGLHWPVGGNEPKMRYLVGCINSGRELSVTPEKVESRKGKTRDGREFDIVTYHFEPQTFEALEEEEA